MGVVVSYVDAALFRRILESGGEPVEKGTGICSLSSSSQILGRETCFSLWVSAVIPCYRSPMWIDTADEAVEPG